MTRRRFNGYMLALAIGLALTAGPSRAQSVLPKASYQYRALMLKEGRRVWGPNAQIALFAAQFHQESAWNNQAKSYVGAQGLGQFMPGTAKDVHMRYAQLREYEMYSPMWSIRALFLYDLELYQAIKPRVAMHQCTHYAMMLSAYNGGLGWVNRDRTLAAANGKNPDIWWNNVELYSKRAPKFIKENRDYPKRIILKHQFLYLQHGYPGVNPCPSLPT